MPHSFFAVYVHLVFSTKNRRPFFTPEIEPRVHAYLAGAVREGGGESLTVGGCADHIHMLIGLPPKTAPADVIKEVKRQSSIWVKKELAAFHDFSWREGYAAFSVSYSNPSRIRSCIQNQQEHHKKMDWEAELRALLRKHWIVFEERYLV